jgi:uncharacterized protein (TIGR02246 family)
VTRLNFCLFGVSLLSATLALTSCNTATPPASQPAAAVDTRAADEAAIRAADLNWVKAIAAKDAPAIAAFYADNAVLMAAGGPIITGKDNIQKAYVGMMGDRQFALTFSPTKIVVAKAGDMAYETGDYQITFSGKKDKLNTTKAMYVVVWAKQPDGSWKAQVDNPGTTTE